MIKYGYTFEEGEDTSKVLKDNTSQELDKKKKKNKETIKQNDTPIDKHSI